MKKMNFLPVMLIAGLCAFTACNDDEKGDVFSDLTTEQHKAKLEDEGIAFAKNMDAVADLKMFDVVDAFMTFQDQEKANINPTVTFGLEQVNALRNGPKTVVNLKGLTVDKGSVSADFENESGVYTWDGKGFVYAPKAGEITYIFPVGEVDATISVYNFDVKVAATQNDPTFVTELPLSLNMSVKLGEAVICSYELTGKWYENDTPELLKEIMTLEGFNFTHELTNTKATLSMGSSFKYNETVIFANNLTIEGNVDYSELMATVEASNGPEDAALGQEVITKANAWFQVGNVKTEGLVNVKGITQGMEAGMETIESEEAIMALLVELANANAQMYVRYADSNEIIAKSEFFMDTRDSYDYVLGADGMWSEVPVVKTEPNVRMVFADESAVESDFFQTGFGDMIAEIDALVKRIEGNFGEEATPVN